MILLKNSPYNYEDEFYCTQCGSRQLFNVPRPTAKQRPAGHLKKMFCFHCKTEKNFVECKPYATKYNYQDFLLEFYGGNFDEKGNRKKVSSFYCIKGGLSIRLCVFLS